MAQFLSARLRHAVGCLMFVIISSGCSAGLDQGGLHPDKTIDPSSAQDALTRQANNPVSLEVEELANDGRVLHAVVRIEGASSLPVQDAVLRLSGFGDGRLVRERTEALGSVLMDPAASDGVTSHGSSGERAGSRRDVADGDVLLAYIAMPVTEVSNYQIELLWGGETRGVLNVGETPQHQSSSLREVAEALVIESVSIKEEAPRCAPELLATGSCSEVGGSSAQASSKLEALLVNKGIETIIEATVLVSFTSQDASAAAVPGESPAHAPLQGTIEMTPLMLPPGAQQWVRLTVPATLMDAVRARLGQNWAPSLFVESVGFKAN